MMPLRLPAAGQIHVWHFNLDHSGACPKLLSEDERERAGRFRFERDAQRWTAGRCLLRRTLGLYLDQPPEALQFDTGLWGKPSLSGCSLRFNLTHSGGMALAAFAWQQEVGIDTECWRSDFSPEELAPQIFSVQERAWLNIVPVEQRHQAFLALWTAKEAYVKVSGMGLSFPLARLTLTPDPETDRFQKTNRFQVQDETGLGGRTLSVCRLTLPQECAAALAAEGPLGDIQHFDA